MIPLVTRSLALALVLLATAAHPGAQGMAGQGVNMPNPKEMSGVPLQASELAPGTLTVRVVRGAMTNPIANQQVEVTGAAPISTNDTGRAEFTGLAPGARVKAVAVVDGERLESQEIVVPPVGGIRVMLVATDPEMAKREAEDRKLAEGPARSGIVVFGDQSRFVFEIGDEGLSVYNIFEIQNTARTPVNPAVPIVFELPEAAEHADVLEGSSPLATAAGKRVTVNGPFPPGTTNVSFAYTLPYSGDSVTFAQKLPAAMAQLTVIVQKIGDMTVTSPQIGAQNAMHSEGQHYIVGQGAPLAAGADVTIAFAGLPHTATWPRNLAVTAALVILLVGGFFAFRGHTAPGVGAERARLDSERERLLAQLTSLEASNRAGSVDPGTYAERKRHLVIALERIYAALDEEVAA